MKKSAAAKRTTYYGVHRGLDGNSVHSSWASAQEQCHGVARARVHGFSAERDAVFFSVHGVAPTPRSVVLAPPPPRFADDPSPDEVIVVYTDGSAQQGRAGVGVFFGVSHPLNTSLAFTAPPLTNQRAELKAIAVALHLIATHEDSFAASAHTVEVRSDSKYAINCASTWRRAWEQTDFRDNTILNRDLIEPLWELIDRCSRRVTFKWVRGHSGVYGNEAADALAVQGAVNASVST